MASIAHFQQIDWPGRKPGICWLATLHDDYNDHMTRPLAMAWLSDFSGPVMGPEYVSLDYIIVPDDFRRRGYAIELIEACKKRWPGLELTDAISKAGQGLIRRYERDQAKRGKS